MRKHLFLLYIKLPEGQSVSVIASQCILFCLLDCSSQVGNGLYLFNLKRSNCVRFTIKNPTVDFDLVRHPVHQRVLVSRTGHYEGQEGLMMELRIVISNLISIFVQYAT